MNYITPAPLKKGDTIGLVTPSSPLILERLKKGTEYLENMGYKVKLGKHIKKADRFLAGTDLERASDIMDFFKDPQVQGIIAMAGGQGSQRVLPYLDYEIIRQNPKMLIGFSDTTALSLGLLAKAGLVTYSGFTFKDTENGIIEPLVDETLIACMQGKSYQIKEGEKIHPGVAKGPLIGGCLTLIASLLGTPYQPNFKNSILFFEDVWTEPYILDGLISHLDLIGIFEKVSGIIIGQFAHCEAKHFPERDGTVDDVIKDWSSRFKVPCIKGFPYGHFDRRCVMPIGKEVVLDADKVVVDIL